MTFVDYVTPVPADWLNNVNSFVNNSNFLQPVASIAALRAVVPTANSAINVTGYYTAGDGGGGTYWYNSADVTSSDNGGTIIVGANNSRWYLIHNGSVTAEQFGAKGNGSFDDTSALTNLIANAYGKYRARLTPGKNYVISSTLNIGNGTSSAVSTLNGLILEGVGSGAVPTEVSPATYPVEITWNGTIGGTMMQVNGPVWGLRLEGFTLNSAGIAATGLNLQHPINSRFQEILCIQHTLLGIIHQAYQSPTNCVTGSQHNTFIGVHSKYPASGGSGILIGQTSYGASPHLDVAQNAYIGCDWWRDGTDAATYSLSIGFADVNSFYQCSCEAQGGSLGIGLYVQPAVGNVNFPDACSFYNCPILGGTNDPGVWGPLKGFQFFGYPTGDSEPIPMGPLTNCFHGFTDLGEVFGGLPIGVGNPRITNHYHVTAPLTFGNIVAQASTSQSVTVTGAQVGDTVLVTNNSGTFPAGGILQGIVNAGNTVLVSWTNASSATINPGTSTYTIDVWHHG